jgi:pimeloyl-ACP methyl ester carboxylesterase
VGKKPFKVLAESLVARGFAVLRYDDRGTKAIGIGASTGSFAGSTLADFSEDVAAGVRFLGEQPELDAARIAVCGHSTGALETAMLLGKGGVPAAAVLLAGPSVQGSALLAEQSAAILRATQSGGRTGLTDDQVDQAIQVQTALIHAAAGDDEAAMTSAAQDAVRFTVSLQAPDMTLSDEVLAAAVARATAPMKEVWMAHFLRYDPAADLAAAKVPVLAVFGGLDVQVSAEQNAGPVTAALAKAGDPASLVVTIPTGNHLFQNARTGLMDEYGVLPGEMGPRLCQIVGEWLERILLAEGDSHESHP